ncbi:MmgE/PrpD family protein [Candidatus Binatia bacterium]|nr:MmgE/PrpD family protein [Candidatus Binatia bacterium]
MSNARVTERIAAWVAQTRFEDIPRRVIEEAKNQILSVLAAVHAGHFSEAGKVVTKALRDWPAGKDATFIPTGERMPLHTAIMGNAALSMALDYDDYLFAGHTGHSSVLVTLALAEKIGVSGKDFLLIQTLANEVGGRLGAAVVLGPHNGQQWSFIHLAGGALATARVLGLDAARTCAALGLALGQPTCPLRPAFFGSDAKVLLAAMTAPTGVQAAQFAAAGLQGFDAIIEHEDGLVRSLGTQPLMGAFEGLGRVWLSDTLSFKNYPGCAYIDTAIDCVLALVRQHNIDARKVKSVHVGAGPLTLGMDALAAPYLRGVDSLPSTLNFTVGYNVAVALSDRELTARQFSRERIRDAAVWELARRVTVDLDEAMADRMRERALVRSVGEGGEERWQLDLGTVDLAGFKASFGARVRVDMEDGKHFEAEQEVPFGGAGRSADERRRSVEEKFRRETRYTLRKEKMERAIDLVLHLDQANAAQVRELVRLCCSERA